MESRFSGNRLFLLSPYNMATTITTTFCVSGAVLAKAGANINSDLSDDGGIGMGNAADEELIAEWIQEAESIINTTTRHNWTDDYSTLNDDVKFILRDIAASLAAMNAIQYDMSGYNSLAEAEAMLDVLWETSQRGLSILRDKKPQDFISGA